MSTRRGFSLIECLAYIAVLGTVFTMAYPAVYQSMTGSRRLRDNADDIVRVLRAGEQWRADVRAATGPVNVTDTAFTIPQPTGTVTYTVAEGALWRTVGGARHPVIPKVRTSTMFADRRAYRWELELPATSPTARVQPLFSFVAVPGGAR